jgi:hypothetical protein
VRSDPLQQYVTRQPPRQPAAAKQQRMHAPGVTKALLLAVQMCQPYLPFLACCGSCFVVHPCSPWAWLGKAVSGWLSVAAETMDAGLVFAFARGVWELQRGKKGCTRCKAN